MSFDFNTSSIDPYPENSMDNLNQTNTKNSKYKTEINDKEKDTFIEDVLKTFDFFYTKIIKILIDKNITNYPILNLDNNIESYFDFLNKINSTFKKINQYQKEVINDFLCDRLYDIMTRGQLSIDSFYHFDEEAYHHDEKIDKKYSYNKKKLPFSVGIMHLMTKIGNLADIYSKTKNFLIKDCNFNKKNFDSRGDFLIPNINNSTKRGNEDYYPPYGWIGIGLDVLGKYKENEDDINGDWLNERNKNSKWANAYFGFYQENNTNIKIADNIKEHLRELVTKNEKLEIFERKVDFDDKRHWKKKYQKGIYLNSKIEKVENDAAPVTIEGKKFKVLLMVRVKIDEISQPKYEDYWVSDKQYIRIYRILFKEIINEQSQ